MLFYYVAQGGSEEEEVVATSVGDRRANSWLQYDSSNLPVTEEQWQSLQFVEKTHWGYYCWPRWSQFTGSSGSAGQIF